MLRSRDPLGKGLIALSGGLNVVSEAGYFAFTATFAAVMLLGVFCRYVLNSSLSWSDELAGMLFVWATFLSIAAGYFHDRHVRIDLLVTKLPPAWTSRVALLGDGLAGGFLMALLGSSLHALGFVARGHSNALEWPLTVPFSAIPVGCALMLVHWARRNIVDATAVQAVVKVGIMLGYFAVVYLPLGQYVQLSGGPRFYLLMLSFVIPLLIGVPVAFAMGLVSTMYVAVFGSIPFHEGARQISYGIDLLPLLTIPLLVLAGLLMHTAGIAEHLVQFAQVIVGRIRGGLGASNVVASLLFGDISGSAVSDTAAIGSLMIPQMKRRGYAADFCAALQGAAGTLALLAPFSVTLILYATTVSVSIGKLAVATIIPAFLLALSFILIVVIHARRRGYPREVIPRQVILPSIVKAVPGLMAIGLIVGGILGGVFSPPEVGTILVTYVLLLIVCLYRRAPPARLYRATVEAGYVSGMTLFMIATSAFLAFVLARDLVPLTIVETVSSITANQLTIVLLVNVVFIVLGMVLEAAPMIFGFLPSFIPLLQHAGVDLVHFGILFAVNMGLGMLIPPVALNLFVSTAIAEVPYQKAVRASLPFIFIMAVNWIVLAMFPEIVLLLPRILFGHRAS